MFALLITFVASAILNVIFTPKPQRPPDARPGTLGDKDFPIASLSTPVGVPFGCPWIIQPNVVYWGNLYTTQIIKSAGGGGGKK